MAKSELAPLPAYSCKFEFYKPPQFALVQL
jgi:hypothetical protein